MTNIAFIGAGNMNRAIIVGLIEHGTKPGQIMVTNPSPEKRLALADDYGIKQTSDNIVASQFADIIVLGVKPHLIGQVCEQIASQLDISNKCFISIAAGCTITQIHSALGGPHAVVRAMPNTPSQLGLGMTGLFASSAVNQRQRSTADQLMNAVGKVMWLTSEAQIDDIIAVSGSGPAYFFLFMEAMQQQARELGFSEQDSRLLVQQTALGAAQMVCQNTCSIAQLRSNVTSKGGTTAAALQQFNQDGLPQLVTNAMNAALQRAQQMAQNNAK